VIEVETDVDGIPDVVTAVVEGALVVVETFVVVDEEHDANTSDTAMRKDSIIPIIPLFIGPPI